MRNWPIFCEFTIYKKSLESFDDIKLKNYKYPIKHLNNGPFP